MLAYATPGVYYEHFDASAPKIAAIRTDVAALVGIAERGPIDTPVAVESLRQFESHFGGPIGSGYLAYCARAYFENGGRRCWIVRVAGGPRGADAKSAATTLAAKSGPGLIIRASSPGTWGNALGVEFREVRRAETTIDSFTSGDRASAVSSTSGIGKWSLVRVRQSVPGALVAPQVRIVSAIDPVGRRLIWIPDDPAARLPTDAPLAGFIAGHPIHVEALDYDLLVWRDGRLVESHRSLSLVPGHERYVEKVIGPVYSAAHREPPCRSPRPPRSVYAGPQHKAASNRPGLPRLIEVEDLRTDPTLPIETGQGWHALAGGVDGIASLMPQDYVGQDVSPLDADEVRRFKQRGIRALEVVDEVALVAVPDIHIQPVPEPAVAEFEPCVPNPCLPTTATTPAVSVRRPPREMPPVFSDRDIFRVQDAMIAHCQSRRDRLAILDPPASSMEPGAGISAIRQWRQRFESKYAALYWPWVKVATGGSRNELTRAIPPSGHVAGAFAGTALQIGVHKAPSNAPLKWVEDLTSSIGAEAHGVLNPVGINVIRALPSRGIRIMGARTLSSDPDARYVNVRRVIMMVIKAVDAATQWAVFEPNNAYTRAQVRVSLKSFLTTLWRQGALMGDRAEEAFFVRCDEANNPPASRDCGRLIVDVGIAPSVPFEFVVVRVGRVEDAVEVSEAVFRGGPR